MEYIFTVKQYVKKCGVWDRTHNFPITKRMRMTLCKAVAK